MLRWAVWVTVLRMFDTIEGESKIALAVEAHPYPSLSHVLNQSLLLGCFLSALVLKNLHIAISLSAADSKPLGARNSRAA